MKTVTARIVQIAGQVRFESMTTKKLSNKMGVHLHGGEIVQMEQQFYWEVLYNLYVLHVGA
jgi:hypothetical protein